MTETPTSKRIDSIQNLLVNTLNQWWSRHGVLSLSATYDASPRFLTLLLYNLLSAKVVFFLQEAVFRNRIFDKPTLLYLHLPRRKCVVRAHKRCDLLIIHYLCGDKDNIVARVEGDRIVVICSKFITFAVTKTTGPHGTPDALCCDLLKIHYLCGDKDNMRYVFSLSFMLWFAQNSLPLRWQRQRKETPLVCANSCDLLKIHYLCGDKDNCCHNTFV